jgi:hypothetical protein
VPWEIKAVVVTSCIPFDDCDSSGRWKIVRVQERSSVSSHLTLFLGVLNSGPQQAGPAKESASADECLHSLHAELTGCCLSPHSDQQADSRKV